MSAEQQPMLPFGESPEAKGKSSEQDAKPPAAEQDSQPTMPSFDVDARREHFEGRMECKREGLERASEKAQQKSDAAFKRSEQIGGMIPMGQPILVGHHSERRHRKDIQRIDDAMQQGVEQSKRAQKLAKRAEKLGCGGVSSDDPDAVQKLSAKLVGMEKSRETMKTVNKQFRAGGWDAVDSISEELRGKLKNDSERFNGRKPFEGFELSNLGANIRRVKQRIELLRKEHQREACETLEGDGYEVEEDQISNRIKFIFEGKPAAETREHLKRNGFRWAPSAGAWQRQLNAAGRFAAQRVHVLLGGK